MACRGRKNAQMRKSARMIFAFLIFQRHRWSYGRRQRSRRGVPDFFLDVLKISLDGLQELLVFDFPHRLISPICDICDQLTKAPIWVPLAEFADRIQEFCSRGVNHFSLSLTLGMRVTSSFGR